MKTTVILAALLGGVALHTLVFAETKTMLGCEVRAVEGSNYYVKADPNCDFDIITGSGAQVDLAIVLPPEDDDGDDGEDPVDPVDPEDPEEPGDEEPTEPGEDEAPEDGETGDE
jgi:hypothetical protein